MCGGQVAVLTRMREWPGSGPRCKLLCRPITRCWHVRPAHGRRPGRRNTSGESVSPAPAQQPSTPAHCSVFGCRSSWKIGDAFACSAKVSYCRSTRTLFQASLCSGYEPVLWGREDASRGDDDMNCVLMPFVLSGGHGLHGSTTWAPAIDVHAGRTRCIVSLTGSVWSAHLGPLVFADASTPSPHSQPLLPNALGLGVVAIWVLSAECGFCTRAPAVSTPQNGPGLMSSREMSRAPTGRWGILEA